MPPKKDAAPPPKPLLGRPSNNLKMGICGLPNVGKSLLFNTLTNSSVPSENYPFCTIDPSEARVAVPDENFDWLVANYRPGSTIRAYLTCIDIAGLVKGASSGEGLGNAFLSHIRSVDALFHVVRAFDGTEENIVHVEGDVDPVRDLTIIREELRIKDIEWVQKLVDAGQKLYTRGGCDKKKKEEWEIQCKVLNHLKEEKKDVRFGDWNAKEIEVINDLQLITAKSVVYLVNLSEEDYIRKKNKWLPKIKEWIDATTPGEPIIPFSGALENAAVSLNDQEKAEFFKSKNCTSVLPKIVTTGYSTLQLIPFYTCGPTEVRAWTIRKGTKAPDAGGVIHSDFRDLFIQVEVMSYADLKEHGSEAAVRAAGRYLQKGRDYEIQAGDILLFRFGRK